MNGQKFQEVTSFKYLRVTLCKYGTYSAEIRIRIASAMAAMARLNRIWWSDTISFARKFKLYKSLVTSILLHDFETWTLIADSKVSRLGAEGNFSASPTWNSRPTTGKVKFFVSPQKPLLSTVKRRKLLSFGCITRHDSFSKPILQATLEGG